MRGIYLPDFRIYVNYNHQDYGVGEDIDIQISGTEWIQKTLEVDSHK